MNCKPGDLAVYVGDNPANLGEIYTVLRPYDGPEQPLKYPDGSAEWWVEWRGSEWHCKDSGLRPIRPDGITTEEVTQLYSPSPVKEVA